MYETFFGLHERPFQLTPNPRFLFLNPRHREALATLQYGLASSPGITLLVGEAGTGKTTLLLAAMRAERPSTHRHVVLSNPTLTCSEFYEMLADGFELPHPSGSKARFLLDFRRDVLARHGAGGASAIVIDEAQSLSHELFEEIRLLANLETATAKLVNVVLVGQPELADRLNDPSLRQLKQRISLRCALAPLDLSETAGYIAARLRVAGADASGVFTKDAVLAIHAASGGIPRTISVVCENALIGGYAARMKPVDRSVVADVGRDFDLPVNGDAPHEHRQPAPANDDQGLASVATNKARKFWFFALTLALALLAPGAALAQSTSAPPQTTPPQTTAPAGKPPATGASVATEADFTIGPEDVLGILFWRDQEMSGDVTVRPDGMITLPLVRDIKAAGLRPGELADQIQKAAAEFIADPSVTVVVRQMNSRKVFITGEVARPGAYPLASSTTVMQLIAIAGGLTEFAESKSISILRVEGGKTTTFDFNYKNVARGKKREQNLVLNPGDTVVVP